MTEQELPALQVATRTCHHSYEHWPLTAPRRMPWLNDMMNRRTRRRHHSLACSLINLQKRRSAGREDQKKKKEERNNNRRSSDGDDGGKVSPSSSFLSQLGGELVAAAGLALLKTRSERTPMRLPYNCSVVVSSEVSTSVCVCGNKKLRPYALAEGLAGQPCLNICH